MSEARKGDHAYFTNLAAEIENGGVAAFRRHKQVNPRQFPISKALAAQRAQTMERTDPGEFRTQHTVVPWSKEIASGDLQDSYTAATARGRHPPPGLARAALDPRPCSETQ